MVLYRRLMPELPTPQEPLSSQITLEEHYVQNEKKFFAAFFTYNFLNQNAIIIVMTAAYDVAHQF